MQHELTFQHIKEHVALPDLLNHYGYHLKKGENLSKGKWHVFEGDDTLVVFKGRGGDWMYFNSQDDRDKGSVIDWMRNRITTGRVEGLQQQPGRNLWQSVNDHFRSYLDLPPEARRPLELPPLANLAPGDKLPTMHLLNCQPLTDTTYLTSRGISAETLSNPQFAGRIFNHRHTVQKEGMPAKTYVNTAFPAYYDGQVVGLEVKGTDFKGQAPDSEFTRSLWLSKPLPNVNPTTLVLGESAIDALSYAQLHPNERAQYASTSGLLTQNKLFEIKRLVEQEHIGTIKSVFDNDAQGHHYDTRLLAAFANESNPMQVVREHKHLLTVQLTTTNQAAVQQIHRQVKQFNSNLTQQYALLSGEGGQVTGFPTTLRDELIGASRTSPTSYQFHVPLTRDALSAFNQAANQHLAFDHKLELTKSRGKDWNDDLKAQQLKQVAARELGPTPTPAATAQPPRLSAQEPETKKRRAGPKVS